MGPSTPLSSRDRARHARREALLEAAEVVFAEKGFEGATMAEIAARAGYSAGNIYNLFESKEELFRAVLSEGGEEALERMRGALADDGPVGEILARFVHDVLAFFVEKRASLVLYLQVTGGIEWHIRRMGDEAIRVMRELEAEVQRVLRRAVRRREIPSLDPGVASSAVLGTLHHYLARWIQSEEGEEGLWRHEEALCETIARAVGAAK